MGHRAKGEVFELPLFNSSACNYIHIFYLNTPVRNKSHRVDFVNEKFR